MRYAEGVPGAAILWLQLNGFLGGRERPLRIAELRVRRSGQELGQLIVCAGIVLEVETDGFLQLRDGLLIECEAVSLTRDVPVGLNWLITPIIQELPKESLEFTLRATKSALAARAMKEARR